MRSLLRRSTKFYSSSDKPHIRRRLQDLLESNTVDKDDPLVKISNSIVDESEKLNKLYAKLEDLSYKDKYRKQLSAVKDEHSIDKLSRDIAMAEPWDGEEKLTDQSLRMIIDSMPKPKISQTSVNNTGFMNRERAMRETTTPVSVRRSKQFQDRMEKVQDAVVRYQQDKGSDPEIDEREAAQFRALYAEKFTPIGSFEKLRSLADARIEESMRSGGFDSVKMLHGKQMDVKNLSTHIDRTDYHLNNILVNQNIVPPWIEKQGTVARDIQMFRDELKRKLSNHIVHEMKSSKLFNGGYSDFSHALDTIPFTREEFFERCFKQWKPIAEPFLRSNIPRLNSALRSYNLQAPLHTQKLYLVPERELQRLKNNVDLDRVYKEENERSVKSSQPSVQAKSRRSFSFLNLFKPLV